MNGHEVEAANGEQLVRFVRALGQHRYVASRLHLVHAFAIEAACGAYDATPAALAEAKAWAAGVLGDAEIDRGSKDERLYRRVTDAELVAVLGAFWSAGEARERASLALAARLVEIGAEPPDLDAIPFDESSEDEMFPVLVDAGWELLPLSALDAERHKGAMAAFDDDDGLSFEVAKFEEENAIPPPVTLHELPALGALELLAAFDDEGAARAPFVLWTSGHETYVDYVLRGVLKVAKIEG
ncbi:MAG: hypothetical protein QOI41_7523 [Myxococcales bacterium]|nr:hypothetical protein [Myxococcales bacterium]